MKRLLVATVGAAALATSANAAIDPVLDAVTPVGTEFQFSYTATLASDQGLINGSRLVIFDFLGYVTGSVSAGGNPFITTVENTSTLPTPPGLDDDPLIPNLVFTWNGGTFHASGGPFAPVDFAGLTARSIFGGTTLDAYSARAITNRGLATGRAAFNSGEVAVPSETAGGIPEPSAWALMIVGFGAAGALLRHRRRFAAV